MIDPAAAHLVAAAAVITAAVHDTDDPDRILEVATGLIDLAETVTATLHARTPVTVGDAPVLDDAAYRSAIATRVNRLIGQDRLEARRELGRRGVSLTRPGASRAALEAFAAWLDAHYPLGVDR